MDIFGSYTFNAPLDRVWDVLMSPDAISSCIPGCDRFEPDGEDRYQVTLTVAMAAITGTYSGTVHLTEKTPHRSYRLVMEGQGRRGSVKGTSVIALRRLDVLDRYLLANPRLARSGQEHGMGGGASQADSRRLDHAFVE